MPAYRTRPGNDQALVTLTDSVTKKRRDYQLGEIDSRASRENYHRLIADWESSGRRLPRPLISSRRASGGAAGGQWGGPTFNEMALAYWTYAEGYYGPLAAGHIRSIIRLTRRFFGTQPAASFGPNALRMVREAMIKGDTTLVPPRKPWSRPYINSQIHRLCRMFKWAASHEMVSAEVYHALKTMTALRRGRTEASEPPPVKPVPVEDVEAVRPYLNRQVRALVDLQLLTGARGGELFKLRPIDIQIDDKKGIWTITLSEHKTAHHGHARTLYLGPRAQNVVRPFLANRAIDVYLFSPAEAEAERRASLSATRKTPRSCGNTPGTNRVTKPRKRPGDHYTSGSYRKAIGFACDRAFIPPEHLRPAVHPDGRRETRGEFKKRMTQEFLDELRAWRREHRWHPHQLRHTAATTIRREFGLEAARIALGHSSALVTDAIYAERDMDKAVEVMRKIG